MHASDHNDQEAYDEAIQFMRSVMHDRALPLAIRLKAAEYLLPFEDPRNKPLRMVRRWEDYAPEDRILIRIGGFGQNGSGAHSSGPTVQARKPIRVAFTLPGKSPFEPPTPQEHKSSGHGVPSHG
jgi:hypothetical protein